MSREELNHWLFTNNVFAQNNSMQEDNLLDENTKVLLDHIALRLQQLYDLADKLEFDSNYNSGN